MERIRAAQVRAFLALRSAFREELAAIHFGFQVIVATPRVLAQDLLTALRFCLRAIAAVPRVLRRFFQLLFEKTRPASWWWYMLINCSALLFLPPGTLLSWIQYISFAVFIGAPVSFAVGYMALENPNVRRFLMYQEYDVGQPDGLRAAYIDS